ncbi:CoA transferase [Methylopila sp. 73B]|uniref:CaiB/BaiF CoA transferase family protein n=1 Tax=Methylopila sp. 73B TaxID=1120792 RepID=UPI00036CC7DC|nr:CoA transferase [Methylopila sp. 73B]
MDHLKGVRVLSFNHFLMGPVGVQFLADLGADVIAVEPPDGAFQRKWGGANKQVDGQTMLLLSGNRNKRSLAIDLKSPEGVEIARKLIATSDVVTENFRPGVLDKLGLGYEAAKAIKSDIIYAAASGFGPDGPYVNRPGQDLIIQALSGLATITGTKELGPRAVGVSVVDHHGAALLAAGILAALLKRERTGVGGRIDVSLLSAAIDLQLESFTCYLNGETPDDVRQPGAIAGWYYGAPYGIYETSDGHIAISLGTMAAINAALDVPEEERVSDAESYVRREDAAASIGRALKTRPTAEWSRILDAANIWHSAINDYADVVKDPQVLHNKNFSTIDGVTGTSITLVNHPVRYDGQAPEIRMPPQRLGAQTAEILTEIGYGQDQLAAMLASGVVMETAA